MKIEKPRVKKPYDAMDVRRVGTVGTVVNKSGTYCDNSSQFESKTFDAGVGNCDAPGRPF